jgi:hypothetical protein
VHPVHGPFYISHAAKGGAPDQAMNYHRVTPLIADEGENREETTSTVGTNSDSENEAANHHHNGDQYQGISPPESPLANEVPNESDQHEEKDLANLSFVMHFLKSNGPPQVIIICLVYALAIGCIVGVVSAESVCFESSKCMHACDS